MLQLLFAQDLGNKFIINVWQTTGKYGRLFYRMTFLLVGICFLFLWKKFLMYLMRGSRK